MDRIATHRTEIGEAFDGDPPNAAHVNTVLGALGGPIETAWSAALATPRAGHLPFVVVLRPDLPVKPFTLFVNKAPLASPAHERLTWGAAQAGVAGGVADAVAAGSVPRAAVDDLLLIAAVWVDPSAGDETAVYENNRTATARALAAGAAREPAIDSVLAERTAIWNPYFDSR